VTGGVTPVSGSDVALWEAGTNGYGTGATQLGSTATSAADGSFAVALASCPSASTQIYLTAKGGNAGGGINDSLMMMAALGPCGSINFSTPVIINEVTTAGSVYALSQFLNTTSSGKVGAPATNAAGLADAFGNAANLMSVASGSALSTTPGGAGTAPQDNLNSIANALGACVQTNGSASANCTELFACALPGAVFNSGACSGGTGSVADTLAAALSIARNPALVSVAGVNDVATKAALFSPALASAPNDWSMPLNFAPTGSNFNEPLGLAIDSSGHIWITNSNGNTVTALNNDGTLFGNFDDTNTSGANFNTPVGVAIDGSGRVWVTNDGGGPGGLGTVTALNSDGSFDLNNSSDFDGPEGVAIDGSGHVWVANAAGGAAPGFTGYVTALFGDGSLDGNFFPAGSDFEGPVNVAIASTGVVWVTNLDGNTLTALHNNGTLVGNFHSTLASLSGPSGIAIDSSGDLWITTEFFVAGKPQGEIVELRRREIETSGKRKPSISITSPNFNPALIRFDSSYNLWVTQFLLASNSIQILRFAPGDRAASGRLPGHHRRADRPVQCHRYGNRPLYSRGHLNGTGTPRRLRLGWRRI